MGAALKYYELMSDESMDDRLKKLVLSGSYKLEQDEHHSLFIEQFYDHYECSLADINMPRIPIQVNSKKGVVEFLPSFLENTGETELESYQSTFNKRFEEEFGSLSNDDDDGFDDDMDDEFDDDFEEDDEDDEDDLDAVDPSLPSLPYRTANDQYCDAMVDVLLGVDEELRDEVDQYGWIENRRMLFFNTLGETCDQYLLPRLPVKLAEKDGLPSFKASPKEINDFVTLYSSRREEWMVAEGQLNTDMLIRRENIDPSLQDLGKNNFIADIQEEHAARSRTLQNYFSSKWTEQNHLYNFPSEIGQYPAELAISFVTNADMTDCEQDDEDLTLQSCKQLFPHLRYPHMN